MLQKLLSAQASGLLLGGNVLCSGFLDSINIFRSQAPPGLQLLGLDCFEPSAWRPAEWLMAVCVVEIGLELSKLILYFPSCSALLNFVQKNSYKDQGLLCGRFYKNCVGFSFWILNLKTATGSYSGSVAWHRSTIWKLWVLFYSRRWDRLNILTGWNNLTCSQVSY